MHYVGLFFKWWQEALFPSKCLVCLTEGAVLCSEHKVKSHLITILLNNSSSIDQAFAVCEYQDAKVKKLIKSFKFNRHKAALEPMSEALIQNVAWPDFEGFMLVPLSLHWRRQHWRGFNQATLLAQSLAEKTGLRLNSKSLIRVKNTQQQAKLSATKRALNLKGAFVWKSSEKPPCKVLLVDDVFTTGATLESAAKTLKEQGVEEVVALVFAYQSLK